MDVDQNLVRLRYGLGHVAPDEPLVVLNQYGMHRINLVGAF